MFGEMLGDVPGVELGASVNVGAVTLNDNGQFHFSGVSAAPSSVVRGVAASGRSGSSVEDSALLADAALAAVSAIGEGSS